MRIRLSTDSSTASASSWRTVQFRRTPMRQRNTNETKRIEQKKSGTTLTTRKAPFAAWNSRFVHFARNEWKKRRKRKERQIEKLEQVSDGTPDSFSEIMATGPKFVFKGTVTTYTFAWNKEGRNEKSERSAKCRILAGLIGERSMIALGWTPTIVEREYQSCSLEILFLQGKPIM